MLTLGNKLTLNSQPIYHFVNKYSIDFDGVDDRIITDGADTVLQNTTYSFWCKSSTTASNKGVFGHGGQQIGSFHFNFDGSKPLLYLGTNLWVYWNDTSAQDDGEWHHYVVYSEPNDLSNCKLYVDGVLQTVSSIESSGSLNAYTESLTIGSERQVGGDSFEGQIDEFAVYDRELTQAEITRMYNTYYSPNRVANGNFAQIGNEEVTNGDFSQEGSELVNCGSFDCANPDAVWTRGTGTTIGSELLNFADASSNTDQSLATTNAKIYKVVYVISNYSAGSVRFRFTGTANVNGTVRSANGTYTEYIEATSTNSIFRFAASGFTGSVDNVSVKEVGQDWTIEDVWTIGDSVANGNGANGSSEQLVQNSVTTIGKIYKVSYEILNYVSGSVFLPNVGSIQSGNGIYTEYITATQTDLKVTGTNFNGSITNISVKEVGQHWTFGTGWSTDGTKALYTAGGSQYAQLEQTQGLNSGATYKVLFDLVDTDSLGVYVRLCGGSWSALISGTGSKELSSVAGSGNQIEFEIGGAYDTKSLSIDNVVVQELKHDATNLMLNAGAYQSANPLITSTKSMEFDGTDDYLNAGVLPDIFRNAFTVSAWVWTDAGSGAYQIISTSQGAFSQIYQIGTGLKLQILGGTGYQDVIDADYFDTAHQNTWVYLALVYNGATIKAYRNGIEVGSAALSGTLNSISQEANIGRYHGGSEYWNGKITEFGLYDRGLTSLEVASLYNQGMPTNLLVNRNNYQSGNPTVFNTKQVDFDGTDDRLEANSTLGSMTASVSLWFKRDTNPGVWEYLFDFRSSSGTGYIAVNSSSNIQATSGNYYIDGVYTSVVPVDNEWHQVVVTGISINIVDQINFASRFTDNEFFQGNFSQAGIWNSTLTADEVSSLYNHGLPIDLTTNQAAYESSSNLVGYWRMGSGTLDEYPIIYDQTNATQNEIADITSGTPVDSSNWANVTPNSVDFTGLGSSGVSYYNDVATGLVSGKTYIVSLTISNFSGSSDLGVSGQGGVPTSLRFSNDGTETKVFTSDGSNIRIFGRAGTNTATFSNFSIKQVNGNPAIMTNQTSSDIENGSPYANMVQNGDFATGDFTSWANNTSGNASIVNNQCVFTNASSGNNIQQTPPIVIGKTYISTFDIISITQGAFKIYADSGSGKSDVGKYSFTWTATDTNWYVRAAGTTSGVIDNVTVSEVNTGLQGYWKMGDGTNDEYPVIYDQTNPTNGVELSSDTNFSSPSSWNTGTNTTISNNKAILTVTGGGLQYATNIGLDVVNTKTYKFVFTANRTSGTGNIVFGYDSGNSVSDSPQISTSGTQTIYFKPTYNTPNLGFKSYTGSGDYIWEISDFSVKEVNGNYATMTNMVEGNITNQYPLTKIRNYYRMGDGILDGYPIIQDQTSPNLAHIPTTNLYDFSEDFSNWDYLPRYSLSYGFLSPDGTNNATKLTAANPDPYIFKNITGATALTYSASIYIKGTTSTIGEDARLWIIRDNVDFPFQDFTITGEWQRIKFTTSFGTTPTSFVYLRLDAPNTNVQIGDEVYIFGAQLEEQSQATAYIKSDGIAAVRKSSTTNLVEYSEDFSQSSWANSNISASISTVLSPDGTSYSYKLTNNAVSGNHFLRDTITVTNGLPYTLSVFIKKGTRDIVSISDGFNVNVLASFDLTNGTVTNASATSSSIESHNNDWFKCIATMTPSSTTLGFMIMSGTVYAGTDESGDFYVWAAQVEQQTQAETYAKTTGLPVTIDLFTENNYGTMTNMSASDIIEDTPNN